MIMIVKSPKLVLTCVAVAALALPAANAAAQPRTREWCIQELINEAARIAASGQVATPTTAQQGGQTTAPAAGPRVSLTLEDAVKLALDRNLDIAVQRLNPEISDLAVASTSAVYLPTLTSLLQTQSQANPSTNTIAGGTAASAIDNGTTFFNGGLAQNLKRGGGSYAVALNNTRSTTTSL